jgi:hypothetical protein
MIVLLYKYFKKLIEYLVDSGYVFNKLIKMGKTTIKTNKNIQEQKSNLFDINEGIGDILVHTSEIKKNEIINDYLRNYTEIIIELFDLIEVNYEKFIKLIANEDILEEWEKNSEEATLKLDLVPEAQFTNLKIIINQFSRLHETSKSQNKEVSKLSIYYLLNILKKISNKKNGGIFVRIILNRLYNIFNENINNKIDTIHMIAVKWYINYLRMEDNSFEYLYIYNKSFKKNISLIIKNNKKKIFKSLIGSLIDGISVVYRNDQAIYEYTGLLLYNNYLEVYKNNKLEEKNKKIINITNKIYTPKNYKNFIEEIEKVKKILTENLELEQLNDKLKTLEEKLYKWGADNLKYNNIMVISCYMGAYCLFAKNENFINEIWNYKQPKDTVATHTGHNIFPEKMETIFSLIIDYKIFQERFAFFEEHHDLVPYMKKYIMLLIFKIQINTKNDLAKPHINKFNSIELENLKYKINQLKKVSNNLIEDKNLFDILKLNKDTDINKIKEKLDTYFDEIIDLISEKQNEILKQSELNDEKIESFKNEFYKNYYDNSSIKNMFNDLDLININQSNRKKENDYSIHLKPKRSIFIKNWYVDYSMSIKQNGRIFANDENKMLMNELVSLNIKNCINIDLNQVRKSIVDKINKFNKDIKSSSLFIFMTGPTYLPRHLTDIDNYRMEKNSTDSSTIITGYFNDNGVDIPVYYFRNREVKDQILLLDYKKIGEIKQTIIDNNIDKSIKYQKDNLKYFFDFEILDLNNKVNRDKYIENYKYKGEPEKLEKIVSIKIYENIELVKDEIGESGYKLIINKEDSDIV